MPSGCGDRILARYPVALIDEFQDTSPVQLRIFDRLYRIADNDPSTALLLIGDPKQSIYRFRGADIHSYLRARRDDRRAATTCWPPTTGRPQRWSQRSTGCSAGRGAAYPRDGSAAGRLHVCRAGPNVEAGAANPLPFVAVSARGRAERLVDSAGRCTGAAAGARDRHAATPPASAVASRSAAPNASRRC